MTTDREILITILERLERLEFSLERLAPARKINRRDYRVLVVLLPILDAMHHDEPFTAAAALETAALRGLTSWPTNAMEMGKLFGRTKGALVNGLCIEEHAKGNAGTWAIRSVGLPMLRSDFMAA